MEIREVACERALVVAVAGKLDWETAGVLEPKLLAAVDARPGNLVLDLTELVFISSGGLRVILAAAKKVRTVGGDLRLASVKPFVRQVLEISGAAGMLRMFASVDEAVAAT